MGALGEGLSRYRKQGFYSFHTPGHKGRQEFFQGLEFPDFDLTELPGLDLLYKPKGIIAEAQKRSAEIFGAEETFFLVNGGTAGNQAMFLALENTGSKRVVLGRNSHYSVFSALIFSGLTPEYVRPVIHPDFNLPLGFNPGERPLPWSEILAWHSTYPTYYGTVFDLKRLLDERTRLSGETPILVDQAHGAHFLGDLFPPSALGLGADLVLQSPHKTLSALTQSALLHVRGQRVARSRLRQSLELLQSSSPSYLLLASLERAGEYALEFERWAYLREEVEKLHRRLGDSYRILSSSDVGKYGVHGLDWSKILLNTRELGISGPRCVEYLRKEFGLEPELWDEENILFVLGIGNAPEDVRLLTKGLEQALKVCKNASAAPAKNKKALAKPVRPPLPPLIMSPRAAFLAAKRQVSLRESLGRIVGETISLYPPGIPVVVMGEQMTGEILEILLAGRENQWLGWDGYESQKIWLVEGEE